jgi:bisphosphoglycerate-dependent phosphoglycerate mutase family 1
MRFSTGWVLGLLCPPALASTIRAPSRLHSSTASKVHTVVMLRHGESIWNSENRFTGWCDIPLTARGEADAVDAGTLMGTRGLKFDVAFTSSLERAWRTCAMALTAAGQSTVEIVRSAQLNERHYGGTYSEFRALTLQ